METTTYLVTTQAHRCRLGTEVPGDFREPTSNGEIHPEAVACFPSDFQRSFGGDSETSPHRYSFPVDLDSNGLSSHGHYARNVEYKLAPHSRERDDLKAFSFWVVPGEDIGGFECLDIHRPTSGHAESHTPSRKILDCSFYATRDDRQSPVQFVRAGIMRAMDKKNLGVYSNVSRKAVVAPPFLKVLSSQIALK